MTGIAALNQKGGIGKTHDLYQPCGLGRRHLLGGCRAAVRELYWDRAALVVWRARDKA